MSYPESETTPPHGASPELHRERKPRQPRPWETQTELAAFPAVPEHIPRRWDRFVRLMGEPAVRCLMGAHVVVVGLGGVGGHVVEALARSAVGRLTLIDFDDVCVTNVNRQLQAFPATVGQSKAELLAARVAAINPDAGVRAVQAFFDAEQAESLLQGSPDFVVDAIDNVAAKIHLLATCVERDLPVVSVTGAGARLDPTCVRVAPLSATHGDPLARVLRKELPNHVEGARAAALPVVFSTEDVREPIPPSWDEATGFRCICPHREDSPHACEKRRLIYGSSSFVTAAFGLAAASFVVRELTGTAT